jgi:hypothetical protein
MKRIRLGISVGGKREEGVLVSRKGVEVSGGVGEDMGIM